MNGWRRGLLVFYSVLMLAFCAALGVLAWDTEHQLDIDLSGFRFVAGITSGELERWLFTFLLGIVASFALLTLEIALSGLRTKKHALTVTMPDGRTAEVALPVAEARLRESLLRLPGVHDAAPLLRFYKDAVESDIAVMAQPTATLAHVAGAVSHHTVAFLRQEFGVTTAAPPAIHLSHDGQGWTQAADLPGPAPVVPRRFQRPGGTNPRLEFPAE
jgi:hypothetical protein